MSVISCCTEAAWAFNECAGHCSRRERSRPRCDRSTISPDRSSSYVDAFASCSGSALAARLHPPRSARARPPRFRPATAGPRGEARRLPDRRAEGWSRNGRNWAGDFLAITAAVMALPVTRIDARRRGGRALPPGPAGLPRTSRPRGLRESVPLRLRPLVAGG